MIYGYARCSTNETRQDITRQINELKEMGATDETIYYEYQSGAKADRAELNKLLQVIKAGDTIVCTEVSRMTRSTKQLCEIIELVEQKKIKLDIKNSLTIDCTKGSLDPMTEGFLKITGVFAEIERKMISERVKSGMRNAKAKGIHTGRAKTDLSNIPANFFKYYDQYKKGLLNKTELANLTKLTRPTVYKYIKLIEENNK